MSCLTLPDNHHHTPLPPRELHAHPHSQPRLDPADGYRHRPGRGQQLLRPTAAAQHRPAVWLEHRQRRQHRDCRAAQLWRRPVTAGTAGRPVRAAPADYRDDRCLHPGPGHQRLCTQPALAAARHGADRAVLGGGTDPRADGSDPKRAASAWARGRHADERPAAGHPAGAYCCRLHGRAGWLAQYLRAGRRADGIYRRGAVPQPATAPQPRRAEIPGPDRLRVPSVHRRARAAPALAARSVGIQPVRPVLDPPWRFCWRKAPTTIRMQ